MKQCKRCLTTKEYTSFNKDASRKDGYHTYCRECGSVYSKKAYEAKKQYYIDKASSWRKNNLEKSKVYAKKSRQKNKARRRADWMHYTTKKLQACPKWLTNEQHRSIKDKYVVAKYLEELTGNLIKYHVDHIVPLRGVGVCGLHVPWNLQILNAKDNMSKKNKY
jgi:hypothetical protein